MADTVSAWAEQVLIPTYKTGQPDKNPMFLEKRVYQGSSGVVYPYPVIDRVFDEKSDQAYTAVFLENRYLKIMLLPELGGRVQMALDKTNGYHFAYYNRVIKPALVGLAGPWISGGIEFNWPQHHRPTTFSPVDWRIEENPDGSRTVWCSELERMFNTKGMHGFTLYPDRACLEIKVKLYNRTPLPQSFLWWANPAVHVNDDYQSVFPPDVHAVMDHGKRAVSDFPIATGTYYKINYAPGTDISRYKNIPVPTSFMAYHSDFDFVGCYDHGRQAGMLHVANHHLVPGKKQWTWGNGDFGRAWDRELTDEDGPYIELMCGAFTDNQPDFSWLAPGEEKSFTQVFLPYKLIGPVKNASAKVAVNLEFEPGEAQLGVYTSEPCQVRVQLWRGSAMLYDRTSGLTPERVLTDTVPVPPDARPPDFALRVLEGERTILAYTPLPDEKPSIPSPAAAVAAPANIASNEELYLAGLHLEQYRHATYAPEAYYEEAIRRDPFDSQCHNALGRMLYGRGKFAEAESHFRQALRRLTTRNPNPYEGEPLYNLGLALKMRGRYDEAWEAFYKAVWNAAWQAPAYLELARLACRAGRLAEALELSQQALDHNASHHQARHLKAALLRRLERADEAHREAALALEADPLDFGALWESHLLTGDGAFGTYVRGEANTYLEISLDYARAGLLEDALGLLRQAPLTDPMVKYFEGWYLTMAGDDAEALRAFVAAAAMPPDFCFPNKLECVPALQAAQRLNPSDARAPYYLGNFWYAHRRYAEAIEAWELARQLDPRFATVHRNLGLAYFNKLHDPAHARQSYLRAFALNPADARVFFEMDQLCKKHNRPPAERLADLDKYPHLVAQRDDVYLERITLLNLLGRPDEALAGLMARRFHPWEGGEGKVTSQYVLSLVEQARRHISQREFAAAIECLERAQVYPPNLGEGKLYGVQENHVFYHLANACEGLGQAARARELYERAAVGLAEPASPLYYNDQPPDMIFYQGLAREKLGRTAEARQIFQKLVDYGQAHLNDQVSLDYFAVSLPDFLVFEEDLNHRNRLHCHYMMALGYLGLGDHAEARLQFDQVLAMDINHIGATIHRRLVPVNGE